MDTKITIPKEWNIEKLEDTLGYVIGGDWGKDENFEDPEYGVAYCIRGSEIKHWDEEKGKTASLRKIKISNIEKRKLVEGDILVEISGGGPEQPVGRTVLIDKTVLSYKPDIPKICTNFLRLIRPKEYVDGKFLNLYLRLFYYSGEIVKYQAGSNNLRNLKFPDYIKIQVPVPPKRTQLAIVSKIEELFSELDKGIEQLKTAQQQLKTYRQSVLKWAFEGKLTEYVRTGGSIRSAPHELSMAAEPEVAYGVESKLPKGWKTVKLEDVAIFLNGDRSKNYPNRSEYVEVGIAFINTGHIEPNGLLDLSSMNYISREKFNRLNGGKIKKGDLVYCLRGATIGKIAFVDQFDEGAVASSLVIIRPIDGVMINRYLYYYLKSPFGAECIKQFDNGTAQPNLSAKSLSQYSIPLPQEIENQKNVVQEIESRLSVADKMEESINQSLRQAEALRQSILKKAFEGRLIN